MALVRLAELQPGQAGVVRRMEGREDLRLRLMEMGLLSGERVRVLRFAPLGDPMEIQVGAYHLSLRRQEAEAVWVEVMV